MAYVPPALRKKQETAQAALQDASASKPPPDSRRTPSTDLPSLHDIYDHFHPVDLAVQSVGGTDVANSTLHSSSAEPGTLKYVVLFIDANPRWSSDKTIFARTNLHLIPGAPKNEIAVIDGELKASSENKAEHVERAETQPHDQQSPNEDTTPQTSPRPNAPRMSTVEQDLGAIAIFEQVGSRAGGMRFAGYHKLTRVQFLEPRSADLVRMLEQKWSIPDKYGHVRQIRRDSEKWIKSLGYRWAVLKFEDDHDANAGLDPPDVKINTERESFPRQRKQKAPHKSVNELLRELRFGKEDQEQTDGEADAVSEDKPS